MEIKFLGTGAADWNWQDFPEGTRGSTVTLLDGHILIDAGHTVLWNFKKAGIDPSVVTDILITHSHSDHFNVPQIEEIIERTGRTVNVYATPQALARIHSDKCVKYPLTWGNKFSIGNYTFTVLPANHETGVAREEAFHFLIDSPEKRVLYALDGGWMLSNARLMLEGRKLDLIIWDATSGNCINDWRFADHNELGMIASMRQALLQLEYIRPDTVHIYDHIALSLWPTTAEERAKVLEQYPGILAEDGMTYTL